MKIIAGDTIVIVERNLGGRGVSGLSGAFLRAAGFTLALIGAAAQAGAIVIRHDVPDARYRVPAGYYPPLVDLPFEGHGILVADQWVVTVGHAVASRIDSIACVTINGRERAIASVIVHPGYRDPSPELFHGDAAPLLAFQAARADIALIRLAEPVRDVVPARLYRGRGEHGRIVEVLGRGASGDGIVGQDEQASHRGPLRRAQNRITHADGAWLSYNFDRGAHALPLEGMLGNGDSGGPVLIREGKEWRLAGLASWQWWDGDLANFRGGTYGRTSYQVRIAHYADWIDSIIAGHTRAK